MTKCNTRKCKHCGADVNRSHGQATVCSACLRNPKRVSDKSVRRVGEFKRKIIDGLPYCVDCGSAIENHFTGIGGRPMRCKKCKESREISLAGKQIAHSVVAKAIRQGEIRRPAEFKCVDCGKSAEVYDHRDYSKPLDVQPVCRSCNVIRGSVLDIRTAA